MAVNKNIAQGNALGYVLNIIIADMDNFPRIIESVDIFLYICR